MTYAWMMGSGLCVAVTTAITASHVHAVERDLGSHEHGAATLDLVIDGSLVYVDFESPWANLVGFEHEPSEPEQIDAVESALDYVEVAEQAFLFTESAGCTTQSVDIESGFDTIAHGADAEHHDEDADDHHADGDADHHDDAGESHSEIRVSYAFECVSIESLESVEVRLLERFPDIEDLDVQMAGPAGQSATELSPTNRLLDLGPVR